MPTRWSAFRSIPHFFSLNLAQAVLLVAYEWFQSAGAVMERQAALPAGRPAAKGELEQLLEHLIAELDRVDFFRAADRRASMSRALKLIGARAELREPDVHLLRGVIKELARGGRRAAAHSGRSIAGRADGAATCRGRGRPIVGAGLQQSMRAPPESPNHSQLSVHKSLAESLHS